MKVQCSVHRNPMGKKILATNVAKPIWPGQALNCEQCQYNDQDIDACPCARCHTRN